ncbi:MAG: phosphodiester glycosidase family protein, partial [Clostridia bacterium]|nr:phosphodiester glycosidase family protein [Clostridia bacterium]
PSPTPTPSGLLGGRFPDVFTDGEPILTEDGYTGRETSFTVTTVNDADTYSNNVTYFVIDIYIQDVKSLLAGSSSDNFISGSTAWIDDLARECNALVAISGDYSFSSGLILRNGTIYREKINNSEDICVLYLDGTMKTFSAGDYAIDTIDIENAWQIWSFGPALLDENGEPLTEFNSSITGRNPRCAIGYIEPGHYCLVTVDGRQGDYSRGLSMSDLSLLMYDLGCSVAYNLDGGATAQLYWQDKIFNSPSGERRVCDIIYIAPEA